MNEKVSSFTGGVDPLRPLPAPVIEERLPLAETDDPLDAVDADSRVAVINEVLPATLRWLYVLRIALYAITAGFALVRIILAPGPAAFLLDLVTDTPAAHKTLEGWAHALQLFTSGLLAALVAMVAATFFIQVRLLAQVRREAAQPPGQGPIGRPLISVFKTLEREAAVACLTGALTVGVSELLAPGATGIACAFGLLAAVASGGLDTLFFHLLFLLREAPVHTSEKQYREAMEQAQLRLADGSMRLQEALIARFEADYRRSAATRHSIARSRRQMREARRQLKARIWVIDHVIPRNQLVVFTTQAKADPNLLERWTEEVDWLVNALLETQRRQGFFQRLGSRLSPAKLARLTMEERKRFEAEA